MGTRRLRVSDLWEANYVRGTWCAFLYDEFLKGGLGKDFDTIRFWIEEFKAGKQTRIEVSFTGTVVDGNHRLVAAKISGVESIDSNDPDSSYIYNTN